MPSNCPFGYRFLWRTDGTTDGTYDVNPNIDYCIGELLAVGNSVYFTSDADGHGREIWRYVP